MRLRRREPGRNEETKELVSERGGGQTALWIVQGPDVVSGKLDHVLDVLKIQRLERVAADTIVVSMTADSAERLQAEFPRLIVEPNRDLERFI